MNIKNLSFIVVLLVLVGTATAVDLMDGLVEYYDFNGTYDEAFDELVDYLTKRSL